MFHLSVYLLRLILLITIVWKLQKKMGRGETFFWRLSRDFWNFLPILGFVFFGVNWIGFQWFKGLFGKSRFLTKGMG